MKPFRLLSLVLISCLGTIVYSNTYLCSFHFDDEIYIINNFAIRNIHHWQDIWKFYPTRFITFLSIAFNYHFHHLNVVGYHLFNLAVHLGSAILVWWLTLLTLSTPAMKGNKITQHADLIALFAGLIFVSHPVQVEGVTYIWQRTASIVALLYMASLCLYIKSRLLQAVNPSSVLGKFYYIFSLIIAIVAMFTKENAVTLPLMILLYEFSFLEEKRGLNWKHLFPFMLTIVIIPLTMVLTDVGAARLQQLRNAPGISSTHYLLTQFRVIVTYIRLIFLPVNQNLDYDYPISKNIFELPTLFSFLFLAGILFLAKRLFLKYRLLSFSIFWFFLTLSLESSVVPLKNIIFEHRLYLPLVGYSIFLVSGVYYLLGKNSIKTMVILLTMIIGFNSILTYQRNKVWKNEITLWDDSVRKSPHKARAYNNRGFAYYAQGKFSQAITDYNKAIQINPDLADAYVGRGSSYADQGNFTQAIADYNKAIEIEPDFEEAYNNRGTFYFHQGYLAQAISDLTHAIDIYPDDAKAYYNRGLSHAKEGNFIQSIADYNKAVEIDPDYADAYYNRGLSFAQQRFFTEAVFDFNKTIKINPDYADAYNNRGIINAYQGDFTQAVSDFTQAIKINPKDVEAHHNREMALKIISRRDH